MDVNDTLDADSRLCDLKRRVPLLILTGLDLGGDPVSPAGRHLVLSKSIVFHRQCSENYMYWV